MNIAILLSGRGSNYQAIAARIGEGKLAAKIGVVVSDVAAAPGLAIAAARGDETRVLPARGLDRVEFAERLIELLAPYRPDLICLAGFMRLLGAPFIQAYKGRIVNIHPSLLPSFPGLHAQRQALEYGVKVTGCTVHLVDEGLDSGPILMQAAVPVLEEDTEESLSRRILEQEHIIYSQAIGRLAGGPLRIEGRRTHL
jgi:phosphoribosylglycinamide formyltransferase-1